MHPTGSDEVLFRGIPPAPHRGPKNFVTSLSLHVAAIGFLLMAAPQLVLKNAAALRYDTTLITPPEEQPVPREKPVPKPVQHVAVEKPAPVALRPLIRPAEAPRPLPKLEQAPVLPKAQRPETVLPVEAVVVRPPVQTGVFGSNAPAQPAPSLPVAAAQDAGFDRTATQGPVAAQSSAPSAAGFDVRSTDSRRSSAASVIQTGGFGEAKAGETRSARLVAANVARGGFDVATEREHPAVPDKVRKTGFDEPKPSSAPVKQAAPAAAAIRPLEILDKPKPVYTAEARAQKIEGAVLLDVIFAATGEVRVLGVVRGLGHGLDENAVDAARHIRFTPAMQSGTPVDQHVVLHVVFQITG